MRLCLILFLFLFSAAASANWVGNRTVTALYGSDTISFGVEGPPAGVCSHYGYHFDFDATSEKGKNILSMLLAARLANKPVSIWYTDGAAPDASGDCAGGDMATVVAIGF